MNHHPTLLRLVGQTLPECEILAFGSRVNGTAHPASDLDLVVRNPKQPDLPQPVAFLTLRSALSENQLPFLVDLHDWAQLPDSFRHSILAHCLLLPHAPSA
ncbi:MAG: nucleotidyltransferase domain-containing protein [Magnetococcales bacterium]|nr:nucleotidyltransferase domain-containing protein [Magnetococcales bacterium]